MPTSESDTPTAPAGSAAEPITRRLALVVAAVLLLWLGATLPLASGERTLYFRDVFHSHLPWKAFGAAELREGRVPAWNPTWAMGQPFRGNPNTVSLYPGNVLYLLFPFWPAFNLHYALHWLLAAVAMFWLARGLGLSPPGAILAALAYGGSGFLLSTLTFYNLLTVVAWWPLAMLGAVRGSARGVALGGLACGLALYGGEPVTALLGMAPLLVLAVERRGVRRGLAAAAGVGAIGALVALPQLVATWRVVGFSFRGSHGVLASQASFYSLDPRRLLELVLPFPFGRPGTIGPAGLDDWGVLDHLPYFFSLHFGLPALVLALLAWRSSRALAALAVGGFALAWALGLSGEMLLELGGGLFRSPEKLVLWPALAIPLLAGHGLDRVRSGGGPRLRRTLLAGALVATGGVAVVYLTSGTPVALLGGTAAPPAVASAQVEGWLTALGMAALLLAATALALHWRSSDTLVALELAALLQLAPLWMTDAVSSYSEPPPIETARPGDAVVVARMSYPPWTLGGESPVFPPGPHAPNERFEAGELAPATGVLDGLSYPLAPDLEGLHHLFTSFLLIEIRDASWQERARWLQVVGANTLVAPEAFEAEPVVLAAIHKAHGARSFFYQVVDPAPDAYWPESVTEARRPLEAFAAVARSPAGARLGVVPVPVEHRPGGSVRLLALEPDRIELEVESEGGVAVVRRAFQPLLRARIAGEEVQTLPVNLCLLGVVVPPGRHRVEITVPMLPEQVSWAVAAATLVAIALVALRRRARPAGGSKRRRRARAVATVATIALLGTSCRGREAPPVAAPPAPAARPDLVLFLIDTLRADRLGAYGYERPVSPRLDAFAAESVIFDHVVAQSSWTRPAMVSIFTGLTSHSHGVNGRLARVPATRETLAEVLAAAGYETAAFVSNANMARRFGVAQGFSSYRMMRRRQSRALPVVEAGLEWLDGRDDPDRPFFLYLHVVEPHAPYRPPPELAERFARAPAPVDAVPDRGFMRRLAAGEIEATPELVEWLGDLYDAEVASVDAAFGTLADGLAQRGLDRDAIVMVLSDHGEELHEHGGWEHGKTLHGEVLEVPLLMRLPGGPRGVRVEEPVEHADLLPTLLDALSLEPPAGVEGRSLLPLLAGGGGHDAAARRRPLFSLLAVEELRIEAVTAAEWRLVRRPGAAVAAELYRLTDDPGETRNLIAVEPELAARLEAMLDAAGARAPKPGEEPAEAALDRKLERRLRAMGYL